MIFTLKFSSVLLVMILKTFSTAFAAYKYVTRQCNWEDLFYVFELPAFHLKNTSQADRLSVKSCDSAHKSVQTLVTICGIRAGMNAVSARQVLLMTSQPRQSISRGTCNPHISRMARRLWRMTYTSFFSVRPSAKRLETFFSNTYMSNKGVESVDSNLTQDASKVK